MLHRFFTRFTLLFIVFTLLITLSLIIPMVYLFITIYTITTALPSYTFLRKTHLS